MKRFKNLLCVVEPVEACQPALHRAVELAKNNQANLTIASVVPQVTAGIGMPDNVAMAADLQTALIEEQTQKLEALVEPHRKRLQVEIRVLVGTPFLQIIREILLERHDLIIKIPERQDWLNRFFSSDDMHLMRKCPCPVWLIKPQAPKAYRQILAAVDVDDYPPEEKESRRSLNHQIIDIASSLALADAAELHVVHVWEAVGESAMHGAFMHKSEQKIAAYVEGIRQRQVHNLDTLLRDVADRGGKDSLDYLQPHKHLVKGWARKEIPALARKIDADLIVMGTVARTGVPGFIMGNTAETILNQIDCSVLAIKPASFVTPITLAD